MTTKSFLYKSFATLALLAVTATAAWGQNNISTNYSSRTIGHKTSTKWNDMRALLPDAAKNLDTFNDEKTYETNYLGDPIQPAHTYIDTMYVKKGSDIVLTLPIVAGDSKVEDPVNAGNPSTREYTRWYNFITEGTYHYSYQSGWDTRNGDLFDAYSNCYRVSNGYVSGQAFSTTAVARMTFHYPTDTEYQTWSSGNNGLDNGAAGNKFYIVACDMSGYRDHTGSLADNNFVEPTLGLRAIFYIVAVDGRGGDNETDMWKNGMGRLELPQYQGGDGTGNVAKCEQRRSGEWRKHAFDAGDTVGQGKSSSDCGRKDAGNGVGHAFGAAVFQVGNIELVCHVRSVWGKYRGNRGGILEIFRARSDFVKLGGSRFVGRVAECAGFDVPRTQ